jgi:hypothetical protein
MAENNTSEKYLLVPMNIEALVVGKETDGWADLCPDFSKIKSRNILGSQLTPVLFETKKNLNKAGVHLHWALPDAMTHGTQGARAKAVVEDGKVIAVQVTHGGKGYATSPRVMFRKGSGATAAAEINEKGTITGIKITESGEGYTMPPTVAIEGGGGTGAEAVARIKNGAVCDVEITNDGKDYTAPPMVTFRVGGSGAEADAEIKDGAVSVIKVTQGGEGYTMPPIVDIEASNIIEFPLIPNRWMVQRICRKTNSEKFSIRTWIVESDHLYKTDKKTEEDAVTFPILEKIPLFDYVGKSFEYKDWKETHNAYRIELTALGYGDPAFAAYYPACRSMLGFHDPMSDIEDGDMLAYMVAGWYSDSEQDILRHFSMEELKWTCDPGAEAFPSGTLCHGTIYGIRWQGKESKYSSQISYVDDKNCNIAVGNTSSEAMAALLADKLADPKMESLLAAFMEDLLADNSDPQEFDSQLHQRRFGSLEGGRLYSIQKKEADGNGTITATNVTLPEELESLLGDLNEKELTCTRSKRELDSQRWELYATWYKWAKKYLEAQKKPKDKTQIIEAQKITQIIEAQEKNVTNKEEELKSTDENRDRTKEEIEGKIEKQFPDLELTLLSAPSFYRPKDPVLLISGPGITPSSRHGQDGRHSEDGFLHCRLTGQEISALIVDIPNGETGIQVDMSEFLKGTFEQEDKVLKGIKDALLMESLLLDPGNVDLIAKQTYINAKLPSHPGEKELIKQIKLLQRPEKSDRDKASAASSPRCEGMHPSPVALSEWNGNPWLPLFLEWQISWHSSYSNPKDALQDWDLGDIDFTYKGAPANSSGSATYEGCTILTPHASLRFKESLEKYKREKMDQNLDKVITMLDNMNILSQTLGGINDALIMRDQGLQMPPINPKIFFDPENESPEDKITDFIKDMYHLSPDSSKPFYPIRAGHMEVKELHIVDAFGQTLDVPVDHPIRAASLLTEDNDKFIQFAPRFAQPLRLNFDWVPTESPAGTYPVNSPVCGWVIPNHLDKNLLFYDGSGTPLGALQKILRLRASGGTGRKQENEEKAYFWVPMPGTDHDPEKIGDDHLKKFVLLLKGMSADTGNAFWNMMDNALNRTDPGEPEDDPVFSILLGRPLALVRASLKLELEGLPAYNQALDKIGTFATEGFYTVKFPLLLGEAKKDNDGLVGFFTGDNSPFYVAADSQDSEYEGLIEYGHSLEIDCETFLELTLLMDPRAKVHARIGILPKRTVTLPNSIRSAAKAASEAFFQVAPLVSPGAAVQMPKPSDYFGKWSWAWHPKVTKWEKEDEIAPAVERGGFSIKPQELSEGWLNLKINPVAILNFWVKEGLSVPKDSEITLAWSLKGGDSLCLFESKNGEEKLTELKCWKDSHSFENECKIRIDSETTYTLVLADKDGYRSEKKLMVTLNPRFSGERK